MRRSDPSRRNRPTVLDASIEPLEGRLLLTATHSSSTAARIAHVRHLDRDYVSFV